MEQAVEQAYSIPAEVVIRRNGLYYLAPSEGYPAIEPGVVQIVDLIPASNITEDIKEEWLGGLDETLDNDLATEWMSKPWVLFQWIHGTGGDKMPMSLFARHVVPRY